MQLSGHHNKSNNVHISHSATHQCSHLILIYINVHISFCYTSIFTSLILLHHLASCTMKTCTPHKSEMLEVKGLHKWQNRAVGDPSTWPEVQCTDSSSSLSSSLSITYVTMSSCRSPLQHEHVQPSGLLCRWPNGLELTAGQAPRPIAIDWHFPWPA